MSVIETRVIELPEHTIVATVKSHAIDFKIYEVVTTINGVRYFSAKDENTFPLPGTSLVGDAEFDAEGFIKWGGCGHITVDKVHFCGRASLRRLMSAIDYIFEIAEKHLPAFDKDIAR